MVEIQSRLAGCVVGFGCGSFVNDEEGAIVNGRGAELST